jgi:hypothetical protein
MQAGATKLPISLDETNFYLFIFNTTFICLFIFIIYLFISIAHTLNCNLCVLIFWGLLDFSLFSIHVKYLHYSGMYSELWIWYRFPHLLLDPKLDSNFVHFKPIHIDDSKFHVYWSVNLGFSEIYSHFKTPAYFFK